MHNKLSLAAVLKLVRLPSKQFSNQFALSICFRHLSSTATEPNAVNESETHSSGSLNELDPNIKREFAAPVDRFNKFVKVPQAWVTGLDSLSAARLGIVDLHPDVFHVNPRLDILKDNIDWQENYRSISYIKALTRAELPGSGRKPWPQKGLGKARHGSTRSPIWKNGGIVHGDRGPKTHFYMLPKPLRIKGLQIALTIKHAQDDLVIVDDLNSLPSDSSTFLHELAEQRNWGYSVLFVDATHDGPRNLLLASAEIPSFNVIPYYGLNCYSLMKHDTLVLTLSALERIEERILFHLNSASKAGLYKMKDYMELNTDEDAEEEEQSPFPPFV